MSDTDLFSLLVVEDEEVIRDGIVNILDWSELDFEVVGACRNGAEALSFIRQQPVDVVLADIRMPRVSGLELAEQLREEYPETRVVVLSGYDHFRYAQRSIELGVVRYLLKPIKEEQLRELFGELAEELSRRRGDARRRAFSELVSAIEEGRSLSGEAAKRLERELPRRELPGHPDEGYWTVALEQISSATTLPVDPTILTGWHVIGPVPGQSGDGMKRVYALMWPAADHDRFATGGNQGTGRDGGLDGPPEKLPHEQVHGLLGREPEEFEAGRAAAASISGPAADIADIALALSEARELLAHRLHLGTGVLITKELVDGAGGGEWPEREQRSGRSPGAREIGQALADAAGSGDQEGAVRAVTTLVQTLRDSRPTDRSVVLAEIREALSASAEYLAEREGTALFTDGQRQDLLQRLSGAYSLEEMEAELIGHVAAAIGEQSGEAGSGRGHNGIVRAAERYIHSHVAHDLSLERVATACGVSQSHLSRLFATTMQERFKDYVLRIRMERAKRLLTESTLKIYEVSEHVGYRDQHYFSRAFRQYTGATPLAYRNMGVNAQL